MKSIQPYFWMLFIFATCGCNLNNREQANVRYNIVCLVAEDISPFLGCYGDKVAYTPNLDKLASEGVMYTHMYSVAGVCAPSRNALITGMYPSSIGGNNMRTNNAHHVMNVPDSLQIPPYECTPPPEVKCYTEFLRTAGYYCINNEKEDYQFVAPKSAWDESSRYAHWRNRPDKEMPFFAIFNFMRSHESQINNWIGEPLVVHPDSVVVPPIYPDTEKIRLDIAQMHTNNTIMDREVGEIIDQLKKDGLLDKTIIIFYSDHGGPLPRGKREVLETGTRVPFIVRFPDQKRAGEVVDELCSFVDIPPTLLSLADVEIPGYMQGQAFLGNQKSAPRTYVYAARDRMDEWFDCRRSVRDQRYRYIRNYRPDIGAYLDIQYRKQLNTMKELLAAEENNLLNDDQKYWFRKTKAEEELYDVENDPYELNNLLGNPEHEKALNRLRKAHLEWVNSIDDKGVKYRTEKALLGSMWPNGIQPITSAPVFHQRDSYLEITSSTPGASIVYQINGEGYHHKHWFLYNDVITVQKGQQISAIAHRIGYKESSTAYWLVD